jgi:MoxR-like ATPase
MIENEPKESKKNIVFSQENEALNTKKFLDELIKDIKNTKPSFLSSDVDKKMLLDNYNYIVTDNAKERLDKLYTYISNEVPVLLEGETGCSKTLSAEIICKYIYEKKNKEKNLNISREDEGFIKFSLSSDVKINDLIAKFIGNKNSLSGLKIVEGPFLRAFKEGIPLILDEINLASEDILQCIEGALDSDEININISGIGAISQKKKEGFCLIATRNPNKDNYMNKRQNLSKSFVSHFQLINFPCFEIEELKEIALKLFESFNNGKELENKDIRAINDLIEFHKEWTSLDEVKNEMICFTIREIAATVKAYIDENKQNIFKIVKVIYGSRYTNEKKLKMLEILKKYESFKNVLNEKMNSCLNYNIPGFYPNKVLNEVIESAMFSLEKKRNIMIVGNFGTGKSHIARGIAKLYNSKINKQEFYHFICTEETKISDLIGYISPRREKDINQDEIIMEWKEGFLSNSIENGTIVILDNLQEADATITERLNGLLDIKYDEGKKKGAKRKFDIPENPDKSSIDIHKDFRIIGVCDSQNITNMSPAFLNRFDIIILENQLTNLNENELKEIIKTYFI